MNNIIPIFLFHITSYIDDVFITWYLFSHKKWKSDKVMTCLSANDMKIFIVISESHLKCWKIAVYRFLISFSVPKLSVFKDL